MNDDDKRFFAEAHITAEEIRPERRLRRRNPQLPQYIVTAENDVEQLVEIIDEQVRMIHRADRDAEHARWYAKLWRAIAIVSVAGWILSWIARH